MARNLVAFPLLILVVIFQSAVVSRITLLAGYADLMLVVLAAWALQAGNSTYWQWAVLGAMMVSFISGMPWFVVLGGYLGVVFLARLLQHWVWQVPMLAMFSVILLGTLFMNLYAYFVLQLFGHPLPFGDSLGFIVLPALLLNILFSFPVYVLMRDLARWVNPIPEAE